MDSSICWKPGILIVSQISKYMKITIPIGSACHTQLSSVTLQYACFCISEPGPVRYGSTVSAPSGLPCSLLQLQFSYSDRSDSLNILLSVLAAWKPTARYVNGSLRRQICVQLVLGWAVRKIFPANEACSVALSFGKVPWSHFALNSS